MSKKNVYFISGGGTGGHIYPAMSVVQELLKREDTAKIYYIGNPKNMEYDIVKKITGVEFLPISVMGMPRKLSFGLVKFFFMLAIAVIKAILYVKKYNPDAVFTTGGYVSAPITLVAPFGRAIDDSRLRCNPRIGLEIGRTSCQGRFGRI